MSAVDWAGFVVALISIIGSVAIGIKWLVKHYLAELKPNSGSSMRDEISELRGRVDTIIRILER